MGFLLVSRIDRSLASSMTNFQTPEGGSGSSALGSASGDAFSLSKGGGTKRESKRERAPCQVCEDWKPAKQPVVREQAGPQIARSKGQVKGRR